MNTQEFAGTRGAGSRGAGQSPEPAPLFAVEPAARDGTPTARTGAEIGAAAQARVACAAGRECDRFLQKSLGNWNPVGCLVAVIDDPNSAASAALALRAAGFFNGHIRIIPAAEMLAHFGGARGNSLLAQIACFVADWSDYASFTAEYVEEARRGHYLVMVYAPALEQARRALTALESFGAHLVRHYEPWVVRGLAN